MKYIIGLVGLVLPLLQAFSQPPPQIKALNIGDKVPPVFIKNILNYPASKSNLAAFKDKLVILDFMTTGCASCIMALPRLDSLQKRYGDQLQIFLVIPESEERVRSFLQRKNIAGLSLPAIAGDTILSKLFPHTYISHEVLIKNGVVKAITYPEYIVAGNIESILEGKNISLPIKRDITAFQYREPILHLNEGVIPDFSYPAATSYSTVTSYMDNVPKGFMTIKDTIKNMLRISMINAPVVELYIRAFHSPQLRPAFIILEVADAHRYAYKMGISLSKSWMRENTYCYEGSFPLNYSESEIKKKTVNDLDFYLGLNGIMEKKKVSCWVITRDSAHNKPNADKIKNPVDKSKQRISLQSIVRALNGNYGNTPVLDETGESEILFYGLNKSEYTDIPKLTRVFKDNGLEIKRCDRVVDLLIIKENPSANFLSNKTN